MGDGDLEHIVDDEIPGEDDKQEEYRNGCERYGIKIPGDPLPGVAPVHAGVQVVLRPWLGVLIAVISQHRAQVFPDAYRAVKHHVQVPFPRHRVLFPVGQGADLLGGGPGQKHVVGEHGAVVLPPAGEGKRPLDCVGLGGSIVRGLCLMGDIGDQSLDLVLFLLELLGGDGVGDQVVGKTGLHGGEQAFVEVLLQKGPRHGRVQHTAQIFHDAPGVKAVPDSRRQRGRRENGDDGSTPCHINSPPRYSRCHRPFSESGAWRVCPPACPAGA